MWRTTLKYHEAMHDYIGEVVITAKPLYNGIRDALGLSIINPVKMYYHGIPDRRLNMMFNYIKGRPTD